MQTEWGQNWLARQVTAKLSKDLQSRISIRHVQFGLFNKMNLEGVVVEDQKRDTLLAAGIVQVRITDWFFLSDKVVLHYIGLKDAVINFNRRDSVWNYQFLQDYFAPKNKTKKSSGIRFNLEKVIMENVAFSQKDAWLGADMYARVGNLDLDAEEISVTGKTIDIASLDLVKPFFHLYNYPGARPPKAKKPVDSLQQWNPLGWSLSIGNLNIDDGMFRMDRSTLIPTTAHFDGNHLQFGSIDGTVKNFRVRGDTLTAAVTLSTTERSGFTVQSLTTDFQLNPKEMEFSKLYLKTNRSEVGDYFVMRYGSLADMSDFIHAVRMEADFRDSRIASDDIAFFAPDVKDWNRNLSVDGRFKGTVDALSGQDVQLHLGGNTSLSGDVSLIGLPNINETFINVTADHLRTSYSDAVTFIPALKKVTMPNLRRLGNITFRGTYTGFINDFVTYGTLQTALGTLTADLNMKLPKNGEPVYSGHLSTSSFQLGPFVNQPKLGIIAFNGDVRGRSFDWKKLDMDINGTIRKIYFNNYTYQNITAKGKLKNRIFDGDFSINDPNAELTLQGLINLAGDVPQFNAVADVQKLNLQELNFSREPVNLAGNFNLQFNGKSIADFLGDARFGNITLYHNGREIVLEELNVSSTFSNGVRTLRANSNVFDATITGQFDLEALPEAVLLFLSRYYPSYIRAPRYQVANQSFTFDITTGVVEDYVPLIDKSLSGFNNSRITGSLDIASNTLQLNATVPQFSINQYQFSDVSVKGDGNFERLVVNGQVNNAIVTDSLSFPQTNFSITAKNDVSDIQINTTANQTINQANLSAQIRTFADGASVFFNPSTFVLNGKTWSIEQGGELAFRKNTVLQGQLVFKESLQEIRISTQPSAIGDWNNLLVSLRSINIGDLSPFFLKGNTAEGLLFGDIIIEDPQHRFNVLSDNIRTEQLRIDNDSIGQVQAALSYNNSTGMLTARGNNADPEQQVNFDLALDLKDSANLYRDRISVNTQNYPVKILERFLGTLFSDMQGFVTGNLDILGEGSDREYIAKARLRDAGLKINFTQVFYKLDDTEIELTRDAIELGTIKLRDKYNNTATVRGNIRHRNFQNMEFDIVAEVDGEPMELINTTYNDNQQFYGRAMGTGSLILIGPQNDMFMQINARASESDSSYITLPPSTSRESGVASFMVERKYGTEMEDAEYTGAATNITYEVNLAANPFVNIEVILDDLTGDVIKGRGVGNLQLRAGTSEPLSLRGRYDIQEGSYLFTFQSFFKKPFVLRKGSNNYIEWNGDPYTATIKFDALYEANDVSLAPLATSLALDNQIARYRGDVTVIASLTGELFRPRFDFQIEFPQNFYSSMRPQDAFALQQTIQQIERNTNELNKQVAFLIATNSFAPFEGGQSGVVNPLNEFAYSTISGLLFGEVNKRLNQLLSKILQNDDLTVNFTGSLYNSNLLDQDTKDILPNQSNLNISVGLPLLNERVLITLGSTFDIPLQSSIEQNVQLFPDVTVEFLINKSGTVRATFFYRQTPDLITTNAQGLRGTQRAGANLAYRRDFSSLGNLFLGKKKEQKKANRNKKPDQPTSDSTVTYNTGGQ